MKAAMNISSRGKKQIEVFSAQMQEHVAWSTLKTGGLWQNQASVFTGDKKKSNNKINKKRDKEEEYDVTGPPRGHGYCTSALKSWSFQKPFGSERSHPPFLKLNTDLYNK